MNVINFWIQIYKYRYSFSEGFFPLKKVYGDWPTIMAATQDGTSQTSLFKDLIADLEEAYDDLEDSSGLKAEATTTSFGSLLDKSFNALIAQYYSSSNRNVANAIYQCFMRDELGNYASDSFYDLSAKWVYYDESYSGNQNVNLKVGFIV